MEPKETITLRTKEQRRLEALTRVRAGEWTRKEAPPAPAAAPTQPHPWTQPYKGMRPDHKDLLTTDTWLKRPRRTDSLAT